jgi:hypothetical protein
MHILIFAAVALTAGSFIHKDGHSCSVHVGSTSLLHTLIQWLHFCCHSINAIQTWSW